MGRLEASHPKLEISGPAVGEAAMFKRYVPGP
jgi:hypothetical protein